MKRPAPLRSVPASAAALSLALLAGCATSGLSPRETTQHDYSSYVGALYEPPAPQAGVLGEEGYDTAPPARLVLPARVAVVQVGEVAPPQAFMSRLRGRPELFARVEGISGIAGPYRFGPGSAGSAEAAGGAPGALVAGPPAPRPMPVSSYDVVRQDLGRMRQQARDMGMDQLLVIGGTIDQATHGNGLSILDLTIVGAFVVPSKEIKAQATAAGALVDLGSGRVVLTASADASKGGLAATATQEGAQLDVARRARDEVVDKLAASLVAECQRRQAAGAVRANGAARADGDAAWTPPTIPRPQS